VISWSKEEFDTKPGNYYTAVVIGKVFPEFRAMAQIPRRPKKSRKLIYCLPDVRKNDMPSPEFSGFHISIE
jgi:hypothetical protein